MKVTAKQYAKVAIGQLANGTSAEQIVTSLQEVMTARHDMRLLSDVANQLTEVEATRNGKILAKITSTTEISKEELDRLSERLGSHYGKPIVSEVTIDPSVIGIIIDINQEQLAYTTDQHVAAITQVLINEEN